MSFWGALFASPGLQNSDRERPATLSSSKRGLQAANRISATGIPYRIERVRRKSIGLIITAEGLVIRAPSWIPIYEIEAAIAERKTWIANATERQRSRLAQLAELRHGGHILFRGNKLKIEARAGLFESIDLTEHQCVVTSVTGEIATDRLDLEIKRLAKIELPTLARDMARAAGLPLQEVRLSSAKTLWGSCTVDGNVRLNFRLVQLPPPLMRHVVAHELAHLVEFNHSARFWAIVAALDPQWKAHRRAVKNYGVLLEL